MVVLWIRSTLMLFAVTAGNNKLKIDSALLMNVSEHQRFPASGQAKDKLAEASWRFMVCLFTSVNMSVFDELLSQSHLIFNVCLY